MMPMGKLFEGLVRKVVLVFIGLTAFSWLLIVIGFAIGSNEDKDKEPVYSQAGINDKDEPYSYPLWIVSISGPFLFVTAVIHAALWKPWSSLFGAITSFLSMWFVTGLGMILYYNGNLIRLYIEDEIPSKFEPPHWFNLEFAGAFMATLFWTIVMIFWQFYDCAISTTNAYSEIKQ